MSAETWSDLGPEARVLRDVMRSRAFGAVSGEAGLLEISCLPQLFPGVATQNETPTS